MHAAWLPKRLTGHPAGEQTIDSAHLPPNGEPSPNIRFSCIMDCDQSPSPWQRQGRCIPTQLSLFKLRNTESPLRLLLSQEFREEDEMCIGKQPPTPLIVLIILWLQQLSWVLCHCGIQNPDFKGKTYVESPCEMRPYVGCQGFELVLPNWTDKRLGCSNTLVQTAACVCAGSVGTQLAITKVNECR